MRVPDEKKLKLLARFGYSARGIVYLIIGGFAVLAALGNGGGTKTTRGALTTILSQPFGDLLLGLVTVGLVGYAGWRALQGIFDTDHHGTGAKGLAIRAGLLTSAVTHLLLAFWAVSAIFRWGAGSEGSQDWTVLMMRQPFGQVLVAAIGVIIVGVGLAHIWKGVGEKFRRYLQWDDETARWACPVSKFGLIARGVVFGIIGGFLIIAALQTDPSEARGLGEALDTLRRQPFGRWLLGIVALGLAAFGIYSFIEGVYRRINIPGS